MFNRLIVVGMSQFYRAFAIHMHLRRKDEPLKWVQAQLAGQGEGLSKAAKKRKRRQGKTEALEQAEQSLLQQVHAFTPALDTTGGLKSYKGWTVMKAMLKSFFSSVLNLLEEVSDASMVLYVLRTLKPYIPLLEAFPKHSKRLLKQVLVHWGGTTNQGVRIVAFLRIRQMAVELPFPQVETCLKGLYLTYVKHAKFVSETTVASVHLMANCIVELYGLDPAAAYQHAFVYIRQLALHLRSAVTTNTKQAIQNVYCWQFINCLKVWSSVLCAHATTRDSELYPLIYPLCQILLGVASLVPTPRFFPLRFAVCQMLNEVCIPHPVHSALYAWTGNGPPHLPCYNPTFDNLTV